MQAIFHPGSQEQDLRHIRFLCLPFITVILKEQKIICRVSDACSSRFLGYFGGRLHNAFCFALTALERYDFIVIGSFLSGYEYYICLNYHAIKV